MPWSTAGSRRITEYLRAEPADLGPGRGRRPVDSRTVPALRRLRQVSESAGKLRRIRRAHRVQQRAVRARPAGRCRSSSATTATIGGVAEAQRVRGGGSQATVMMLAPGIGTGVRVHRPPWPAARRRHAGRHGGGAHARAAASARREGLPMRLRRELGLRRGLHDALGPAVSAGREARAASRARAGRARRSSTKQRAFALRGLAQKGDALAARDLRFSGERAGAARRRRWPWRSTRSSS